MITIIFGATGAGKTAFATYLLKEKYMNDGKNILRRSRQIIEAANLKYGRNLTPPPKVPFYTNYKVKLHVGYKKYYEPFYMNGHYFGVTNDEVDTQHIAPGSKMVLDEAQRIVASRESSKFPSWASYGFEIHRQAEIEIYLLAQRGNLIDRNIKELGVHVIEIRSIHNEKDVAGNIIKTTWKCREFSEWSEAERYIKNGEKTYKETEYTNEWSIFDSFDSFEKLEDFLPPKGQDFDYLPQDKPAKLTKREKRFYTRGKPSFKGSGNDGNENKGD